MYATIYSAKSNIRPRRGIGDRDGPKKETRYIFKGGFKTEKKSASGKRWTEK